jgi:hypothetical protein
MGQAVSTGSGLREEESGGKAARPPAPCCLPAAGPGATTGEEVQSVTTNRAIFITAVRQGEGAEEQPPQFAIQTRTCSAEARSPELEPELPQGP